MLIKFLDPVSIETCNALIWEVKTLSKASRSGLVNRVNCQPLCPRRRRSPSKSYWELKLLHFANISAAFSRASDSLSEHIPLYDPTKTECTGRGEMRSV